MDLAREQTESASPSQEGSDHGGYEAPQGDLETAIAEVWRDSLGLERVGRTDNYFELGGNSLLGMDLTELLANRLGFQVPVVMLFQYPTVREMAELLSTEEGLASL